MNIHCFFEQSGTFKNVFKDKGYNAFDYDLQDIFFETDYMVDLYEEIENAYLNKKSIFDKIKSNDLIIAFFPCVRFENQIILYFKGEAKNQEKWNLKQKLKYDLYLHESLNKLYSIITKLVIICLNKHLKLIIENPYSSQHYLTRYWAAKPAFIDMDRSKRGDHFKKPTQFYFFNITPKSNFCLDPILYTPKKRVLECNKVERSIISREYAKRFIEEFIL